MNIAPGVEPQQNRILPKGAELKTYIEQWLANHAWFGLAERSLLVPNVLTALGTSDILEGECHRVLLRLISESLYAECCSANRDSQELGFGDLAQYLSRIARFKCKTEEMADEAVNNTLLALWQSLASIRQPAAFLGFAKVSLIREIWRLSKLQRGNMPMSLDAPMGEDEENEAELGDVIADTAPTIEVQVEDNDTDQHLRQAVLASPVLTARDKTVIILMWIEDYSQREVCQILKMKPGALHTLLSRLRDKIPKDLRLMALLNINGLGKGAK